MSGSEMSRLELSMAKAADAVRRSNAGEPQEQVERFVISLDETYECTLEEAKRIAVRVSESAGRRAKLRRA